MTTLDDVIKIHKETCDKARSIIEIKGRDYNRGMQDKDTLFNISVGLQLGIVDSIPQGILVRLSDKIMRLISLTKNPLENPDIVNESVNDTIEDTINYLIYLKIKYNEARNTGLDTLFWK